MTKHANSEDVPRASSPVFDLREEATQPTSKSHVKKVEDLEQLGITGPFKKRVRRDRCPFTAREDAALMQGFRKHGPSWKCIKRDSDLGLSSRTSTDLRDRFRNRWPDEYAAAGKKLHAAQIAKKEDQEKSRREEQDAFEHSSDQVRKTAALNSSAEATGSAATASAGKHSHPRQHYKPFSFGRAFDDSLLSDFSPLASDEDADPVRLNRDILDLLVERNNTSTSQPGAANPTSSTHSHSTSEQQQQQQSHPTLPSASDLASGPVTGQTHINPLMTLKTGRPPTTDNGGFNLPSVLLAVPLTELPWTESQTVNLPPATDVFSPSELTNRKGEGTQQPNVSGGGIASLQSLLWDFG